MAYISQALRRQVIERAGDCCEYCLQSQLYSPASFHVEHIIAEKHRGQTVLENLCLSCPECNAFKGSDIGSMDIQDNKLTPLYNPREDQWSEHFVLRDAEIEGLTPQGRVTVFLLQLNHPDRLAERELMIRLKVYPCK